MKKFRFFLVILIAFLTGAILTSVAVVMTVQHLGNKYILNFVNNELPKIINRKVEIKNARISLLTGTLTLDNLRLYDMQVVSKNAALSADKLRIKVDITRILQNKFSVREIHIENGTLTADLQNGSSFCIFTKVNAFVENPFLAKSDKKLPLSIKVDAKIPSQKKGAVKVNLRFDSISPKLNFTGEFEVKNVSVPYFYSLLHPARDVAINDGTIDIKSTIHCADNWLTVSNVVSINKLDVRIAQKKVFGISTELITEFFKNNNVTFDLPVNGNVHSLRFDFSTAVTQIMMKALQDKLKDDSAVLKVSEKLGRKIGGKLGADLTKLLYPKR